MRHGELLCRIALQLVPGVGSTTINRLIDHFGSAESVWDAGGETETDSGIITPRLNKALRKGPDRKKAEKIIEKLAAIGTWTMAYTDETYPDLLRQIQNPPSMLFGLGDPSCLGEKCIAMVGSRRASHYGMNAARSLSAELVDRGFTIVSGLAMGIDTACHEAALRAGGRTVAVTGCGLDIPYPRQNMKLSAEIQTNGAVISEFLPGTAPEAKNFPIRNRIISGLSLGVVVVEASLKSGSLITAACALDQGRDVVAVPGNIFSYKSRGAHWLIKQGARLVENGLDIAQELGEGFQERRGIAAAGDSEKKPELPPEQKTIFDILEHHPQHIDDIAQKCGLPVAHISGHLLQMELKELVQSVPGQRYQLKQPPTGKP